ncbi:MAG TPA: 4'-phosphopantetheinyl transferase superfamily protein [Ferruginibacter sp.]|nr:4'-phosphopantetheinyl transferase superfamily protein [Ferruginibacter sp.]HRO97316.1 4'-phosphopantetheinyl transferase superfamily protein [Ferruginibacter sp.]HRP50461.1 4'-phosphopantetheinyl transferase superfamily protein [Ferruginibacter sp.]
MPLVYQQDINLHTKLGIWHITEEEDFFSDLHSLRQTVHHPQKRLQTLAGRHLLKVLFPEIPLHQVQIAPTRKPFIPGDPYHFSISHCAGYAAAIVSTVNRVGIDIEWPQPKVLRLQHKFLSEAEAGLLQGDGLSSAMAATIGWSIKEAVFKWYGLGGMDFRRHMVIEDFQLKPDGHFQAVCRFKKDTDVTLSLTGQLPYGLCCVFLIS